MMDFKLNTNHPSFIAVFILYVFLCTGEISGSKYLKSRTCKPGDLCADDLPDCTNINCTCIVPSNIDCSVYYRCFNGKAKQERCPQGLLFNIDTVTCDYGWNVDCKSPFNPTTQSSNKPPVKSTMWSKSTSGKEVPTVRTTHSPTFTDNPTKITRQPTKIASTSQKDKIKSSTVTKPAGTESSTEPWILDKCPEGDGIYSDLSDCRRYYVCTNGIRFHKRCPSNLHFNPSILNCDYAETAGCAYPANTTSTVFPYVTSMLSTTSIPSQSCECDCCIMPVENDCSSFIICIGDVSLQGKCQNGLYFNPVTSSCDLKQNVQCLREAECSQENGRYPIVDKCSSFYSECIGGVKHTKKCSEGLLFDPQKLTCSWTCKDKSSNTTVISTIAPYTTTQSFTTAKTFNYTDCPCDCCFLSDPHDCSSYTMCIDGKGTHERCAEGLVFNQVIQNCDYEHNVVCPKPTPKPTPQSSLCPEEFGLFPHPENCGEFVKCSLGIADIKKCPGILHFNSKLQVCDWPWLAGCRSPYPSPPDPRTIPCDCDACIIPEESDCSSFVVCIENSGRMGNCSSGLLFNPNIKNCDLAENVKCKVDPEEHCPYPDGLYPYPNDCRKFVHCSHNVPHVKYCPSNLNFNSKLKVCDWSEKAGCNGTVPTSDPHPPPPTNPCDVCECCFIPDEDDCSSYTYCESGTGIKMTCSNGLFFNPEIENCDYADNVQCHGKSPDLCPKSSGLFPDEDCTKFVHCSHGTPHIKSCPAGLHFSPHLLVCDWPWRAGCGSEPIDPDKPEEKSCECDCCFLPHESQCEKFYLCLNGTSFLKECTDGLVFNPKIENCDYPSNVNCSNWDATTLPSICSIYDGLYPNPSNCSTFYHCSNGQPHLRICPSGLHFNAKKNICDHPCEAICDLTLDCSTVHWSTLPSSTIPHYSSTQIPVCKFPNGLFPNPSSCTSYYQCSNGFPYFVRCPSGLHFSEDLQRCDFPCVAMCDPYAECSTASKSTTISTIAFTNATSKVPSFSCETPNGIYPNPESCSSYYQCSNGYDHLIQCPFGLHFSKDLQYCDYPCSVKCDASLVCPTTSKISTKFPIVSTSQVPTFPSFDCETPNGIFANPKSCSSYYQCSHGYSYLTPCPFGLHFSESLQRCDYPCIAKCDSSLECPTTNQISTKFSTIPTSQVPTFPSFHCETPNGMFSNPESCTSYYQCSNGYSYLTPCPFGLHFSESLQRCDYPCSAKCDSSLDCPTTNQISTKFSTIPTSQVPTMPSFHCEIPNGMFANPESCASYYQCSYGYSYLTPCPFGLHFSVRLQRCDYPCIAKCDPSIDCPTTKMTTKSTAFVTDTPTKFTEYPRICKTPNGMFSNPESCSSYYQCSNGYSYLVFCPSGLHFSDHLQKCDYPCAAKCDPTIYCPSTKRPTSSASTITVTNPTSEILTTSTICRNPNGMFANPKHCGSYYQCSNGYSYLIPCPPGLHFSEYLQRCDYPCIAKCDHMIVCPTEAPFTTSTNSDSGDCSCVDCRLADPLDCSAYYECLNGKIHKKFCPLGMLFNMETSFCEKESDVNCISTPDRAYCLNPTGMFPMPGKCRQFVHCDAGIPYLKDCPGNLEWDQEQLICNTPKGRCENHTIDARCLKPSGHFPNPEDCGSFYHCDHGVAYLKHCPSILLFNYEIEMCDWPWNVSCGSVIPTSVPTPDPYECKDNPEIQCTCSCRVPDYIDCKSFYQCLHDGKSCKKTCPVGLLYNKNTMVCDLPQNVECRDQKAPY